MKLITADVRMLPMLAEGPTRTPMPAPGKNVAPESPPALCMSSYATQPLSSEILLLMQSDPPGLSFGAWKKQLFKACRCVAEA